MAITGPAPSGVNMLPVWEQAAVFGGTLVAISVGALVLTALLSAAERALPGTFKGWKSTWPLLGAVFLAAGITHFSFHGAYEAIYPPQGTWGVWQLPGSAEFHVAWTGVAEIAGGAGLLIGAAADALGFARLRWLKPSSAACLAALTLAVTPANVYMYTHGAMMDGLPGPPVDGPIPVSAHFARFALQAVLLALLAGMARDASSGPVDDELSA
ncbi:hypothetical protein KFE25_013099 [Diacronema lutheri]|uniref:Uncharacterized protein n=2 Tax=Diacronema lutheri TaxID=2081491 RepID=A0A8J6C4R7_DIALT|nr:hypothetical protein KFE25_013099 [Diacronema lutheri]